VYLGSADRLSFCFSLFHVQTSSFSPVTAAMAAMRSKAEACILPEKCREIERLNASPRLANERRRTATHNIRSQLNESESESCLYICIAGRWTYRYTSRSFSTIIRDGWTGYPLFRTGEFACTLQNLRNDLALNSNDAFANANEIDLRSFTFTSRWLFGFSDNTLFTREIFSSLGLCVFLFSH